MRVLVVFESLFGNTWSVVDAVASGLRDQDTEVTVHRVGEVGDHDLGDVDLLVLAGPTHAFSMSRPGTRADAATRGGGGVPVSGDGVREWLEATRSAAPPRRPPVAVLDTRARVARHWPGSAAWSMARSLRRMGFRVTARASFYVADAEGPLLDGELERARAWGRGLAGTVAA